MSGYDKGEYLGEIMAHGFDEVGKKKTPCCKIDFKITALKNSDGEYIECDAQYVRNVTAWFSDKNAKRAIADIRKYAGWEGDDLGELNGDALVGNQIEIVCKGQDDGGYDDFDFPFEGGGKTTAKKNDKVAKLLRNKYNKLAKSGGNGKPKKANKPVEPEVEPEDDDDSGLPF